jgi:hypothetical protein
MTGLGPGAGAWPWIGCWPSLTGWPKLWNPPRWKIVDIDITLLCRRPLFKVNLASWLGCGQKPQAGEMFLE